MSIAELIITLPNTLIDFADIIYNALFTSFKTPLGNVSLFALIFGFGLIAIITIRIVRMFLP
jgi:hypothetical protein